MIPNKISFAKHINSSGNRKIIWLTAGISVLYFVALRLLYPIPSYCGDSYTFISTARFDYPVSYRPILYSKYLNFFHKITTSDLALIAGQYLANVAANLFLFFTCTWVFAFTKKLKVILYLLLIVNPFYLFYSNYITSDPFFNSLTVVWFTLLIWMVYRPSWYIIAWQLIILSQLFLIRYNAIYFPAFMWLAIFLGRLSFWKKAVSITTSILMIVIVIYITKKQTLKHTGTDTFTAFSGWQLANNALHIIRNEEVDTTEIKDKQTRFLVNYCKGFFDTTTAEIPALTSHYMWHYQSPLKEYMKVYDGRSKYYFRTWSALGPVYNNFAKTIILQNPVGYLEHFVLPNAKEYLFPKMEIYKNYFEHVDTIGTIARKFYKYKIEKRPAKRQLIYDTIFTPWKYLFPLLNMILIILGVFYLTTKAYLAQSRLFNYTLIIFTGLFFANFFFIILLAPSVFRYHIFIVTLAYPIILLLAQSISTGKSTNKV